MEVSAQLTSISPSGRLTAVVKAFSSDDAAKHGGAWGRIEIHDKCGLRDMHIAKTKIITSGVFGASAVAWSPGERYLAFVCERGAEGQAGPSSGSSSSSSSSSAAAATTTRTREHAFEDDWGEQMDGATLPVVALWALAATGLSATTEGRVFTLTKALPAGWSFGCPVFPPDGSGIVMVGWPKVEERRMGLIYYSTRPSTLFFVPGPNEKSSLAWVLPAMPLTPNDHSARFPRFSPDGRTMLYTTSEEKRAHCACSRLRTLRWADVVTAVAGPSRGERPPKLLPPSVGEASGGAGGGAGGAGGGDGGERWGEAGAGGGENDLCDVASPCVAPCEALRARTIIEIVGDVSPHTTTQQQGTGSDNTVAVDSGGSGDLSSPSPPSLFNTFHGIYLPKAGSELPQRVWLTPDCTKEGTGGSTRRGTGRGTGRGGNDSGGAKSERGSSGDIGGVGGGGGREKVGEEGEAGRGEADCQQDAGMFVIHSQWRSSQILIVCSTDCGEEGKEEGNATDPSGITTGVASTDRGTAETKAEDANTLRSTGGGGKGTIRATGGGEGEGEGKGKGSAVRNAPRLAVLGPPRDIVTAAYCNQDGGSGGEGGGASECYHYARLLDVRGNIILAEFSTISRPPAVYWLRWDPDHIDISRWMDSARPTTTSHPASPAAPPLQWLDFADQWVSVLDTYPFESSVSQSLPFEPCDMRWQVLQVTPGAEEAAGAAGKAGKAGAGEKGDEENRVERVPSFEAILTYPPMSPTARGGGGTAGHEGHVEGMPAGLAMPIMEALNDTVRVRYVTRVWY